MTTKQATQTTIAIPPAHIEPHPDNRTIDADTIKARAESMKEVGQLEPIDVTKLDQPRGKVLYRLISGETRWRAAKLLKWKSIDARVREGLDDATALALLAAFNEQRQNLDDIQRANLIERLCAPVADGGAGMKRKDAAAKMGLTSSAASNLVKLLKLDDAWRQRVRDGLVPQRIARVIARFAPVPGFFPAMSAWYENEIECDGMVYDFLEESRIEYTCQGVAEDLLHPIEGWERSQTSYGMAGYGHIGCLFDWQQHEGELQIVELPSNLVPPHRLTHQTGVEPPAKIKAATHGERYVELQTEAIEEDQRKRPAGKASSSANGSAGNGSTHGAPKQKTLGEKVAAWRDEWLRALLAEAMQTRSFSMKLFIYVIANSSKSQMIAFHALADEVHESGVRKKRFDYFDNVWPTFHSLTTDAPERLTGVIDRVNRIALLGHEPSRTPPVPFASYVLEDLARDYELDLAEQWSAEQGKTLSDNQVRLLKLHTIEELTTLAGEWGVYPGLLSTKAGIVKHLSLSSARLPLPKIVKPLAAPTKSKPKRKAAKRKKRAAAKA